MEEINQIPKPESGDFELGSIDHVNHKPHPYCITPKHLTGDHMYLNAETIREAEQVHGAHCGMYTDPGSGKISNAWKNGYLKCQLSYDEHTSDKVLFIKIINKEYEQPSEVPGLQEYCKSLVEKLKELKIDGIAFIGPDKK